MTISKDYLVELTEGQKAGLTDDDQALLQRGVIDCNLELNSRSYITAFLFKKFKKEIAQQAKLEIMAILDEKEAVKAKAKSSK